MCCANFVKARNVQEFDVCKNVQKGVVCAKGVVVCAKNEPKGFMCKKIKKKCA